MRVIVEAADTAAQEKLAEALEVLGVAKLECSDTNGQQVVHQLMEPQGKLHVIFDVVSKSDVMMVFLTMYERGQIVGTKDALQSFLSAFTNLGTKESVHKLYVRSLHRYVRKGH